MVIDYLFQTKYTNSVIKIVFFWQKAAVDKVISKLEDVAIGSLFETIDDWLDNRVVDEVVVVGIFLVVTAACWLPHYTLKFPPNPPESILIHMYMCNKTATPGGG